MRLGLGRLLASSPSTVSSALQRLLAPLPAAQRPRVPQSPKSRAPLIKRSSKPTFLMSPVYVQVIGAAHDLAPTIYVFTDHHRWVSLTLIRPISSAQVHYQLRRRHTALLHRARVCTSLILTPFRCNASCCPRFLRIAEPLTSHAQGPHPQSLADPPHQARLGAHRRSARYDVCDACCIV